MKFYFPLLSFFALIFHTRIYHDVIGGNLDDYVKKYPNFQHQLNSFKVNWVETNCLKKRLETLGIYNCEVMPNFKRLNCVEFENIQTDFGEPFYFCTFSRVMKEKGIEDAILAVESINAKSDRILCKLDIYGKVDESYKNRFDEVMKKVTPAIKYGGLIPYDRSVEAIKSYYALLFPTYWDGEGFAGTIVDGFAAGLPVIASDWNCNREIIENKINGIIYPSDGINDLQSAIQWAINNPEKMEEMKISCLEKAKEYQPDKYIKKMIQLVERHNI